LIHRKLETNLKPSTIFMTVLLFGTINGSIAQGQTGHRRVPQHPTGKPKPVTPVSQTLRMNRTPSGLVYVITRRSTAERPQPGETVIVHYTGLLGSGVKFDSSVDRGQPFKFKLGAGRVIKGWDEGIAKLRVGEQATLIIPPHLGYGAKGAGGVIPPDATLIFVVELIGVEPAPPSQ
jgi:peptidylprolyl isomerase